MSHSCAQRLGYDAAEMAHLQNESFILQEDVVRAESSLARCAQTFPLYQYRYSYALACCSIPGICIRFYPVTHCPCLLCCCYSLFDEVYVYGSGLSRVNLVCSCIDMFKLIPLSPSQSQPMVRASLEASFAHPTVPVSIRFRRVDKRGVAVPVCTCTHSSCKGL